MSANFRKLKNPSPFRMMAANTWKAPNDPHLYGVMEVDMTKVLELIERYRKKGIKLTVTHVVIKAAAVALARHPEVNAKVERGHVYMRDSVDIFVLVDVGGAKDLSGIILRNADKMSLEEIARRTREEAGEVKKGNDKTYGKSRKNFNKMPPWMLRWYFRFADLLVNHLNLDLSRMGMPRDPFGSALVTSLGMFSIEEGWMAFPPLARAPVGLLVTRVKERPWAEDGKVVVRPTMKLCATLDHRIIDGYHAAVLDAELRDLLTNPEQLE